MTKKLKYPQPVFDNQSITLNINHHSFKTLDKPVWLKTHVFNKRFNLKQWESVCWEIEPPFKTDGASTQVTFWLFLALIPALWYFDASATVLAVTGVIALSLQKLLNPLAWHLLTPAVGHDYMCRYQFIHKPYIYNEKEDKIVGELEPFGFNRIYADLFMFHKIGSFEGHITKYIVFPAIALFGLLFNDNKYVK